MSNCNHNASVFHASTYKSTLPAQNCIKHLLASCGGLINMIIEFHTRQTVFCVCFGLQTQLHRSTYFSRYNFASAIGIVVAVVDLNKKKQRSDNALFFSLRPFIRKTVAISKSNYICVFLYGIRPNAQCKRWRSCHSFDVICSPSLCMFNSLFSFLSFQQSHWEQMSKQVVTNNTCTNRDRARESEKACVCACNLHLQSRTSQNKANLKCNNQ